MPGRTHRRLLPCANADAAGTHPTPTPSGHIQLALVLFDTPLDVANDYSKAAGGQEVLVSEGSRSRPVTMRKLLGKLKEDGKTAAGSSAGLSYRYEQKGSNPQPTVDIPATAAASRSSTAATPGMSKS